MVSSFLIDEINLILALLNIDDGYIHLGVSNISSKEEEEEEEEEEGV